MQVGEHWVRKGIDGWRLDVPDEITTPGFWEEFRERVRAINPETYIVGEIWEVKPEYLAGTRFDALMNYVFTEAALAFCGRDRIVRELQEDRAYNPWPAIDGRAYAAKIHDLLGSYDWNIHLAQMNLLDSHDTSRAITLAGGDTRSLELAALLLFTYPGAPTVYYGDEIGLEGGLPDKWARKTFPWDDEARWNHDLRGIYQRLIALRRDHEVLRTGSYRTLAATKASYAFRRELDGQRATVVANTSDHEDTVTIDSQPEGRPAATIGGTPVVTESAVTLPARSAAVWIGTDDSTVHTNP
jgi:glycosidase